MYQETSMEELEEELAKLKKMEELTPDIFKNHLDSEFWIVVGLRQLYELCKKVEQLRIPDFDNTFYAPCKRVIKSKILVPNYLVRKHQVDCVVFMGFFMVVEGYYIHSDMMENFFNLYLNSKRPPTKEELEDFEVPKDSRFETVKQLNNGYGFIMTRNPINDLFISCTKYDYLEF